MTNDDKTNPVTSRFDSEWKKIEHGLDLLAGSGLLEPGGLEDLQGKLQKLKYTQYTIAVCGGVKAGKSKLINSLFFGDSILPEFDSPMTAKITYLRARDPEVSSDPYSVFEFYSHDEWDRYQDALNDDSRRELDERVRKAAELGVTPIEWIGHLPVRREVSESVLREYVADMNRGGKYTPFVKSASVHIDHPVLRNLQIVDTPGLNDSNRINSDETDRWIGDAHAVIYVFKHDGAHEDDVEFFRKRFPSKADSRIFVQNQIDLARTDYHSVKEDIRRYGQDPFYRNLRLFGPDETICSYSALYALLSQKVANGKQMSDDDNDWWDDRDESFDPDPDHLAEKLSEKLYKKEGRVRIASAQKALWSVLTRAEDSCLEEKDKAARQLRDCELTLESCKEEIKKFEEAEVRIKNKQDRETDGFKDVLDKQVSAIRKAFRNALVALERSLESQLLVCGGDRGEICSQIPRILRKERSRCFEGVKEAAGDAKELLSRRLQEILDELKSGFAEAGIYDSVYLPSLDLNAFESVDELINGLPFDMTKLYEKLPTIWGRFFKGIGKGEVLNTAINDVMCDVESQTNLASQSLCSEFYEKFGTNFKKIVEACLSYCAKRRGELKERYETKEKSQERKDCLVKAQGEADKRLERIAEYKKTFEHEVGGV